MRIVKATSEYRLTARKTKYGNEYIVQVIGLIWHNVKVFADEDDAYAYNCAEELYEMLIDTI